MTPRKAVTVSGENYQKLKEEALSREVSINDVLDGLLEDMIPSPPRLQPQSPTTTDKKLWKPRDPYKPGAGQKLGGEFRGVIREV